MVLRSAFWAFPMRQPRSVTALESPATSIGLDRRSTGYPVRAGVLQLRAPRAPESCLVDRPMSEDCLSLNVWRPTQREGSPLPVMVWFHGGGFRIGGTSLEQYDGSSLASHGVIVVTVNYRLGIFGVFPHPALAEPSANFGLLDQMAALRWVQRNIAAFGGDADNVTAFGESAGGASDCLSDGGCCRPRSFCQGHHSIRRFGLTRGLP